MVRTSRIVLASSLALALGCSNPSPTTSDSSAQRGAWGSSQAGLTVTDSSSTLRILASGGCYGSYGTIAQRIPTGSFGIAGTYTQLMGVYPGKVEYAAQYSGTVSGTQMSLLITVPALQQTLGPYSLAYGVNNSWTACLYP